MLPTYLFIYHLVSSAVPSFPNLFLQLIITVFLQFSKVFPTCWCMLSFDFISFSHQFRENMERSTIFHGKIWKDPQFFMGKYGKIHHFPLENMERFTIFHGKIWKDPPFSWENMERSTIFHGKIWKDPPFFMGNSFTAHMNNFLSVIFVVVLKWRTIRIKMLGYFPSGICIQNVFESYNILLSMSFSNKFLDTWKDNA